MDTSTSSPRAAGGDDAPCAAAFLGAFSALTTTDPDADLQELFISAIVECAGPPQLRTFLRRLDLALDATGRLNDAQHAQWQWLVLELRLMEELDTKRFDAHAVAALARLEQRVESGNDPDVAIAIIGTEDEGENDGGTRVHDTSGMSWGSISKAIRDSSRLSLGRLGSSGSGSVTRVSLSSASDASVSRSSRHSRQLRPSQSSSSDQNGFALLQRNSSAVSDSVPTMVWAISSKIGMTMEETFHCQICFENVPVIEGVPLTVCRHRFCIACIKSYIELKIADGQVYPVCFHEMEQLVIPIVNNPADEHHHQQQPARKACGTPIAPCDIESLVPPDVWKKYLMFKFNKENKYGRQCPHCDASQVCAGPEHPECECTSCAKLFCFTHGNAHADATCADFELKQAEQEKLNRSAIAEISKPCPGCKSNVEKSGGCNHMKCVVCSTDFCWICGAVVDSNIAPMHFQWWNVRGCAGQQMEDVESLTPSERFWMGVMRIAMVIFLGPPALAITLVLTLLTCCCLPCVAGFQLTFRDCFTTCLNFAVLSLVLLLTGIFVAITFVGGIVWRIVTYPITCYRLHSQNQSHTTATAPPPENTHVIDQSSVA